MIAFGISNRLVGSKQTEYSYLLFMEVCSRKFSNALDRFDIDSYHVIGFLLFFLFLREIAYCIVAPILSFSQILRKEILFNFLLVTQ